jgi:hypothetical protein
MLNFKLPLRCIIYQNQGQKWYYYGVNTEIKDY